MDDEKIINLFWERAENAISETSDKYGHYCYAIANRILFSAEDSEECLNDTWLAAWNAIPPTRPRILRVFLGKITRNLAMNRYDYLHAQKRNRELDTILSELGDCLPAVQSVEEEIVAEETVQVINAFLRELTEEKRRLFLRRYWYCDSLKEAAGACGMSESKAKTLLFRLRNLLKEQLEREGVVL